MHRVSPWVTSTLANLIIGLTGLATSILLARTLGPTERGILAEAMLWPSLVLLLGVVNIQSVVYFWSKAQASNSTNAVLGTNLILCGLISLILLVCAWGLNYLALGWQSKASFGIANIYALTLPVSLFSACLLGVFLAERRFVSFWGIRLGYSIFYPVSIVVLALTRHLTLWNYIVVVVGGYLVQLAAAVVLYRRSFSCGLVWDQPLSKAIIKYGAKTNLASLPYHLNLRLDQLLMSVMLSPEILGYYVVAYGWSSMLSLLGGGISSVMLSRSSSTDPSNKGEVLSLLATFRTFSIIFVGISILGAAAAPIGIPILFGQRFAPSLLPAAILCLSSAFLNMNLVLHELARGLGYPGLGISAEAVGLVFTIVLLIILLPLWGGVGAAIASLVSYLSIFITLLTLVCRRIGVSKSECMVPRKDDFIKLRLQLAELTRGLQYSGTP